MLRSPTPPVELKNNRLASGRGVTGVLLNALERSDETAGEADGVEKLFIVVVDLLFS